MQPLAQMRGTSEHPFQVQGPSVHPTTHILICTSCPLTPRDVGPGTSFHPPWPTVPPASKRIPWPFQAAAEPGSPLHAGHSPGPPPGRRLSPEMGGWYRSRLNPGVRRGCDLWAKEFWALERHLRTLLTSASPAPWGWLAPSIPSVSQERHQCLWGCRKASPTHMC